MDEESHGSFQGFGLTAGAREPENPVDFNLKIYFRFRFELTEPRRFFIELH